MTTELALIIISSLFVSAVSLFGAITLFVTKTKLNKVLIYLVAFSAGTMLGSAFIHLIPEAVELIEPKSALVVVLFSFVLFFILEEIFHWHHDHEDVKEIKSFGKMNLIGDAIHNFIDGLIIAAAFLTNPELGITTTIAIAFHEIPQEIGDFGVLLYAGYGKRRAVFLNIVVATFSLLGGVIGYYLGSTMTGILPYLLAFAAGGFLYIATSDLIPELKKVEKNNQWIKSFLVFLSGILLTYILGFFLV